MPTHGRIASPRARAPNPMRARPVRALFVLQPKVDCIFNPRLVEDFNGAPYNRGSKLVQPNRSNDQMYDRDMPLMSAHALASPSGLVEIIAFVLCTIQQLLQSVARQ